MNAEAMMDQAVRSKLGEIVGRYGKDPTLILSMLQDIQGVRNYLPREWLEGLERELDCLKGS